MFWLVCVCSCMDLTVKVLFLHSGKVTLIWAGVLSGMSPLYGTKDETLVKQNCTRLFSVASESSSTAELRKHELPLPHTHLPLDDSVTSLEPGVKEARLVLTTTPGVQWLWSRGALGGTPQPLVPVHENGSLTFYHWGIVESLP